MDLLDILLRLGAATLFGAAIGLNRHLHHKSTGLRTMSLVGLGGAMAVLAFLPETDDGNVSRVVQGLVAGIGFLGAGVIVRSQADEKVHGLTTAASIWVTALMGVMCGLGLWRIAIVSVLIVSTVLLVGGKFEKRIHRWIGDDKHDHEAPDGQ